MNIPANVRLLFSNITLIYLTTRYITYFIQFISSVIIAVKLGPFYMGIWGIVLLMINYFQLFNFGIPHSSNVLLVQNKGHKSIENQIVLNSLYLITGLAIIIIVFGIVVTTYSDRIVFFKYIPSSYFWIVCVIAILIHVNQLMMNIFRVYNLYIPVMISQSLVPCLSFLVVLFFSGELLLKSLLYVYCCGYFVSVIFFIFNPKFSLQIGTLRFKYLKMIFTKGSFLFVYNFLFYLIIVSTRTVISYYYPIEDFGRFTFSYTLGHSLLLLFEAFSFLAFPKVMDRFITTTDNLLLKIQISEIQLLYTTVAHFLVYTMLSVAPFVIPLIPKYTSIYTSLSLISLALIVNTHSFSYSTFLMTKNKEKILSLISAVSLILNILLALFFVHILKLSFEYVILSTMISYFLFSILNAYFCFKIIDKALPKLRLLSVVFNYRLMLPFFTSLFILILDIERFSFIPLLFFCVLNVRSLRTIFIFFKKVITSPSLINLKR